MTDIFNIFPKDIWIKIISLLRCKFIYDIRITNKQFNVLCIEQKFIEKRKFFDYPRKTNQCECYDISKYLDLYISKYYNIQISDITESIRVMLSFDDYVEMCKTSYNNNLLEDILDKLYDDNIELVRGDLIYFRFEHVYLFDGEKLYNTKKGSISVFPDDLDIIKDNLSFGYWDYNKKWDFCDKRDRIWNFFNGSRFCFNNNIKEEILNNFDHNRSNKIFFILNNKKYTIVSHKKNFLDILRNDHIYLCIKIDNDLLRIFGKIFIDINFNEINDIYWCV